jgi:protein-tyrosine phosphatase
MVSMILIDIHAHILPGLDDGAVDSVQALGFAKEAEKQGVTTVFATPHCCDGVYDCDKDTILAAAGDLAVSAREAGLTIQILPGAEIRITHDLIDRFDQGRLLTLGDTGKFLLLELPPMFITAGVFRMIRQLQDRGVTPVIAHAERNPMILDQPCLAAQAVAQGALMQVTAGSLTGDYGKDSLRAARTLLKKDLVFCLGSDIHPGRKYRMARAEKLLKKWVGRSAAETLLFENPTRILPVLKPEPALTNGTSWKIGS